jgi:hypothetical protein
MLSKKQNLLETISGGKPDRFVKQYEPFALTSGLAPHFIGGTRPVPGAVWKNPWGVTYTLPLGGPGIMPVHTPETTVVKDILRWRESVEAPPLDYPEAHWKPIEDFAAAVDRNEQFLTLSVFPGLLEQFHFLLGMENAMMALALEPEESAALIDYYVDWEIEYSQQQIDRIKPDVLFRHDDWGSAESTLLSPAMFADILVPAYKKLYGFYKSNGIQLIVHHSDSYAATLVPYMIEIGIDIWQGVMTTNNTPELIRQYGGQISFMGDIDNREVDQENWTVDIVEDAVQRACERCGIHYFIPSTLMGDPKSVYPGVYDAVNDAIDKMSAKIF